MQHRSATEPFRQRQTIAQLSPSATSMPVRMKERMDNLLLRLLSLPLEQTTCPGR